MANMLSYIDVEDRTDIPVCDVTARTTANKNKSDIGAIENLHTLNKSNLVNAINEISDNELAYFISKKVCVVGDSISAITTYPPNWVVAFEEIISRVGATVTNVAVDGASVAGFARDVTAIPDNCDIYIIFLGINDFQGQFPLANDNIGTYVSTIMNRINKVGVDVWYVSPIRYLGIESSTSQTNIAPANAYRCVLETLFNNAGARIISGLGAPMLNSATRNVYMTDGLHPKPEYRYILANYILKCMLSGASSFSNVDETLTFVPALLGTGNCAMYWGNNEVLMRCVISGAEFTQSNFEPVLNTLGDKVGVRGLLPDSAYFPSVLVTHNGDKFYIKNENGIISFFPFGGNGTYDLTFDLLVPLFYTNNIG